MPEQAKVAVANTTPLIALTAATGNLDVLRALYTRVIVPYEVAEEIRAGGEEASTKRPGEGSRVYPI